MEKNDYKIVLTSWGYVLKNGVSCCGYFRNKSDVIRFLISLKKSSNKNFNPFKIPYEKTAMFSK